jgi:hypothetical protein
MTVLVSCTLDDGAQVLRRYDSREPHGLTHAGVYTDVEHVTPPIVEAFRTNPPMACVVLPRHRK